MYVSTLYKHLCPAVSDSIYNNNTLVILCNFFPGSPLSLPFAPIVVVFHVLVCVCMCVFVNVVILIQLLQIQLQALQQH